MPLKEIHKVLPVIAREAMRALADVEANLTLLQGALNIGIFVLADNSTVAKQFVCLACRAAGKKFRLGVHSCVFCCPRYVNKAGSASGQQKMHIKGELTVRYIQKALPTLTEKVIATEPHKRGNVLAYVTSYNSCTAIVRIVTHHGKKSVILRSAPKTKSETRFPVSQFYPRTLYTMASSTNSLHSI